MQRSTEGEMTMNPCPEAWPGGVIAGIDAPCRREFGHPGRHKVAGGDLSWSGRMTDQERAALGQMRAEAAR